MKYLIKPIFFIFFCVINTVLFAQAITLQKVNPNPFANGSFKNVITGDVDNDNDIDVIVSGKIMNPLTNLIDTISILYLNDGAANYTAQIPFEGLVHNKGILGDIDGDGYLDLILSGQNENTVSSGTPKTHVFKFVNGNFVLQAGGNVLNLTNSSSVLFDIDNDSDLDLIIMGQDNLSLVRTVLYKNDGFGNFTENITAGIRNLAQGQIIPKDVDGDNDIDFVISGVDLNNQHIIELYINNGLGSFTANPNLIFTTQYALFDDYNF